MQTNMLLLGNNTYVNPQYITRIEPSYDIENSSCVYLTDGGYIESGYGYPPDTIIDELHKINCLA